MIPTSAVSFIKLVDLQNMEKIKEKNNIKLLYSILVL